MNKMETGVHANKIFGEQAASSVNVSDLYLGSGPLQIRPSHQRSWLVGVSRRSSVSEGKYQATPSNQATTDSFHICSN
jgi:hypothetical protein